jgi:hypothetical protein
MNRTRELLEHLGYWLVDRLDVWGTAETFKVDRTGKAGGRKAVISKPPTLPPESFSAKATGEYIIWRMSLSIANSLRVFAAWREYFFDIMMQNDRFYLGALFFYSIPPRCLLRH